MSNPQVIESAAPARVGIVSPSGTEGDLAKNRSNIATNPHELQLQRDHGLGAALQSHAPATPRAFKIRGADSAGQRSSVNVLIQKRYAWRGYDAPTLAPLKMSNRITLTATDGGDTIGTITVVVEGVDGKGGTTRLQADNAFSEELAALRAQGHKLCEFTKLAVDEKVSSKRLLAALFHVAILLAHRIRGCDLLVIEVNPRHVGYYRRTLNLEVAGAERTNDGVNAPAVLMKVEFAHIEREVQRLAGRSNVSPADRRLLYCHFFSPREEAGLLQRLKRESW